MTTSVIKITTRRIMQNGYLVFDNNKNAIILDPGFDAVRYLEELRNHDLKLEAVLATHAHFDHIAAVDQLIKSLSVGFYLHRDELEILRRAKLYANFLSSGEQITTPKPSNFLDGDCGKLNFGGFSIDWLKCPGHTPGGVCFIVENNIFTGDLILPKDHFSQRLPGADKANLSISLARLSELDHSLTAHPGHGNSGKLGDLLTSVNR
jgi:hydroxyacylglutathione hydrolase